MFFNLFSILEKVDIPFQNVLCASEASLDLECACLYPTPDVRLSRHILYVVTASDVEKFLPYPVHLISNQLFPLQTGCTKLLSYTAVPEDTDLCQLFCLLQDVFFSYCHWFAEMQAAILARVSFVEIMEKSVRFLHNPIALFDDERNLLYCSSSEALMEEDSLWRFVLEHGYSPDLPETQAFMKSYLHEKRPFLFRSNDEFHHLTRLIAPIYCQDSMFGCIGCTDSTAPFTKGEYADLCMVQDFVNEAVRNSPEFDFNVIQIPWFVSQLLKGKSVNRNVISHNLRKYQVDVHQKYFLLTFQMSTDVSESQNLESILYNFSYLFHTQMAFCYNSQIVIIDHDLSHFDCPHFKKRLNELLKKYSLIGGISMIFPDFTLLHQAFMQSQISLAAASQGHAAAFRENVLPYALRVLRKENEVDGIIYPGLDQPLRHAPDYGRELLECLKAYLVSGCNITATARLLFLHRNTVMYRLEQLRKYCPIDFDSLTVADRIFLLLSCEILLEPV